MWPDPNLPGQERLGWAVSFVGDFNGDGADDFVLSAPYDSASGYPAMIYFFYGPRTQGNLVMPPACPEVGFTITTSNTYNVGWHVAGGFDLNADGFVLAFSLAPSHSQVHPALNEQKTDTTTLRSAAANVCGARLFFSAAPTSLQTTSRRSTSTILAARAWACLSKMRSIAA